MQESILIEKGKNGDRKALSELVKLHENTVYNFAFKICRDKDKAENTMQETFLSMLKSLHTFDGNSKLSTWLYRIVVNHCLMLARKSGNNEFVEPENEDELYDNKYFSDYRMLPDKIAENNELRVILDKSISKLSPEYRAVFLLRDVEELSTEETAKVTRLSVPAVKSRLHRARAFLRNEISEALKK